MNIQNRLQKIEKQSYQQFGQKILNNLSSIDNDSLLKLIPALREEAVSRKLLAKPEIEAAICTYQSLRD